MTAAPRDLYIEQGAAFILSFTWYPGDPATTTPNDLTGATAAMQIRDKQGGTIYVDATDANGKIVLGGVAGTIAIELDDADTNAILVKTAVYDLEVTLASGVTYRLLQGRVTVSPNITQAPGDPVLARSC
jgi:FtsP/CotA-like multicopper oxidase with cupredoxin domain